MFKREPKTMKCSDYPKDGYYYKVSCSVCRQGLRAYNDTLARKRAKDLRLKWFCSEFVKRRVV